MFPYLVCLKELKYFLWVPFWLWGDLSACRSLCLVIWVVGYLLSICWKVSIVLSKLQSLFRLFNLLLKYFRLLWPVIVCIMFVSSDGESFSSVLEVFGWILFRKTFVCLANFSSSDHLICQELWNIPLMVCLTILSAKGVLIHSVSCFASLVPCFASASAFLLPLCCTWALIQISESFLDCLPRVFSSIIVSLTSVEVILKASIACRAAWLSEKISIYLAFSLEDSLTDCLIAWILAWKIVALCGREKESSFIRCPCLYIARPAQIPCSVLLPAVIRRPKS